MRSLIYRIKIITTPSTHNGDIFNRNYNCNCFTWHRLTDWLDKIAYGLSLDRQLLFDKWLIKVFSFRYECVGQFLKWLPTHWSKWACALGQNWVGDGIFLRRSLWLFSFLGVRIFGQYNFGVLRWKGWTWMVAFLGQSFRGRSFQGLAISVEESEFC